MRVYVQEVVVSRSTRCIQAMERQDVEESVVHRAAGRRLQSALLPATPNNPPYNPSQHLLPSLVGLECQPSPPLSLYLRFHFAECFANLCWPLFLSAEGFLLGGVRCVCRYFQYICITFVYCFISALEICLPTVYLISLHRPLVFVLNKYLFKTNTCS